LVGVPVSYTVCAYWQRRLPDPSRVADRIRAIPLTPPRTLAESGSRMSMHVTFPPLLPEHGQRMQRTDGQPPRLGPQRGLLAALAAVHGVGIGLLVPVLLLASCGVAGSPPVAGTPPGAPTSTVTVTVTAAPTQTPAQTWTTIQAFTAGGNYRSASFQVTSPWRLVWQCNLSMGNPGPYPLQVDVLPSAGPGGTSGVINTVCKTGNTSGTTAQQSTPTGLVYLSVSSAAGGEWDVRVQVLR